MSSNVITIPGIQIEAMPWVDELHQWLTTVDHNGLEFCTSSRPCCFS